MTYLKDSLAVETGSVLEEPRSASEKFIVLSSRKNRRVETACAAMARSSNNETKE
jgi:hypothetical protein